MLRINQFNLEPGVYVCDNVHVVVSEIQTHTCANGYVEELVDPIVIYRDLEAVSKERYITYGLPLSKFNHKFIKV